MTIESVKSSDSAVSTVAAGKSVTNDARAFGYYIMECYDSEGKLKWRDELPNLVVNVGLQFANATVMKGSAYTAAWYIGLYGAGASNSPAAGDTMASHAGWTEVVPYSNATRPVCTFGTATTANPSVNTNSASVAAFTCNATSTVGGAFLVNESTKSGATGTLFSASDFSAPGDRAVVSGDTLNVTYTFNLAG
jgi:hypothetical protein